MPATDELDLGTTFGVEIGGDAAQANVYLAAGLPYALIDVTAAPTFQCDFILRLASILLATPMILIGPQRSLQAPVGHIRSGRSRRWIPLWVS